MAVQVARRNTVQHLASVSAVPGPMPALHKLAEAGDWPLRTSDHLFVLLR